MFAAEQSRVDVPDTGSLREDVLTLMRTINATRVQLITVMSVHLADYYQETGTRPGDLLATGRGNTADVLFDRAVERGEIKPEHLSERIKSLPFDLLRHEILTTFTPCPTASSKRSSTRSSSPLCADRDTSHKRRRRARFAVPVPFRGGRRDLPRRRRVGVLRGGQELEMFRNEVRTGLAVVVPLRACETFKAKPLDMP